MSAEEFARFIDELDKTAPAIGDALQADEGERTPDMEIPVLWMSSVGHAVSSTLVAMADDQQRAIFDEVESGMRSGGELLRTALATGLLEAIANDMDRGIVPRDLVATLLGAHSRAYLEAWDQFTLGESSW